MTSSQQRAALQRQIWAIANDVRGSVDGWDFKQYVLGTLFYRFISENFIEYITGGDDSVDYGAMDDNDELIAAVKEDAIRTKGYFIYPSQLFSKVASNAKTNENLNTDLSDIFSKIESSPNGYPSEQDIKGLFADFDTTSNRLGNTVKAKNQRLADVLKGVAGLEFGGFESSQIDLFGDAYEFLISNYAANAGKSGGEFFTPQHVSKLIAQLAMHGQTSVNKIYDPACGSGSLLLQAKKQFDDHIIEDGFWGQELNHTTYNLARMNMFLHNVNYDKFDIQLGDTLIDPHFGDDKPFDAIVSNPPYSVKWKGSDDPTLINDDRYAPAGVLAPKSKADFAFVLHALSYLSSKGRAAIVCFPGIFYRGGAEKKIRQYLVDNNYVETVISLAPNLFYGTTIAVNILVLSKSKTNTNTQFIDASGEDFCEKVTNNNVMLDEHIKQVMDMFDSKADIDHVARLVPYEEVSNKDNDYNLSVSSYVQVKDTRKVTDIAELNAELTTTVSKIDQLRSDIGTIRDQLFNFEAGEVDYLPMGKEGIGEFIRGGGLQKKDFTKTGVGCIHYGQLYTYYGTYADKTKTYVSKEFFKKSRKAKMGDLVIATTSENDEDVCKSVAWLGKEEIAVSSDACIYRHSLNPKYVSYFFQTEQFQKQKRKYITGIKVRRVNADNLAKVLIPVPSPEEQARIVDILDKFEILTSSLTESLAREVELRQKQYEYYRDLLLSFPKPKDPKSEVAA